jgi:cystathionine gamma-synthase
MSPVKVISQQPPGGRCTLYARYADAICAATGWTHAIVHSENRDAHGEGYPSLWIRDAVLQPEDFFMLTADDICAHLAGIDVDAAVICKLRLRLQAIFDEFVESASKGTGKA